jgi:hypothetical protein
VTACWAFVALLALSVKVKVAGLLPVAVGLKKTTATQLLPGDTEVQVLKTL